jgi:23S rRNA (adenine2503-C2)-methyltransferase
MLQIAALRERLAALGANPRHASHALRVWAQARPTSGGRPLETFLPRPMVQAWPGLMAELDALATLRSQHPAADGGARLLVDLADGESVEAVLLPRGGVCVSTQVGCAVACRFCMTGQGGLRRQLDSAEIVAQVVLARRLRAVRKVVFMGMGEPAHNLDAVLEAIELLGEEGGIGHKSLVLSTVGDERVFERLPRGRVKPALALSLHTTRAELRAELLPRAPRLDPADLVMRGDAYARATGYPLQLQWTLLAGVNDGDDEVEALIPLLRGRLAMLNLIPYNTVEGLPYQRPSAERAAAMARALNRAGIVTRLRQSAAQDVDGGCGQLRARSVPPGRPLRVPVAAAAG